MIFLDFNKIYIVEKMNPKREKKSHIRKDKIFEEISKFALNNEKNNKIILSKQTLSKHYFILFFLMFFFHLDVNINGIQIGDNLKHFITKIAKIYESMAGGPPQEIEPLINDLDKKGNIFSSKSKIFVMLDFFADHLESVKDEYTDEKYEKIKFDLMKILDRLKKKVTSFLLLLIL